MPAIFFVCVCEMDIYSQRHGHQRWNVKQSGPDKGLDWESSVDKFLDEYQPREQRRHSGIDMRRQPPDPRRMPGEKSKRLFLFYCDAMKARGYGVATAEEMMRLWVEAGCDEDKLQEKIEAERPRSKEAVRLVIMKLLGRLREDQIPRSFDVAAMIDVAVDYFWGVDDRPERRERELLSETRGRGDVPKERLSGDDRLESLIPLQKFVVNAMANSFSNAVFVNKVSMFIQKMISVAGYDLRSLQIHFDEEGPERLERVLGGKLGKYEAALPNGITIQGIVNMTVDFLGGSTGVAENRSQRQNKPSLFEPPPFFQGYPLPDVSHPPPPQRSVMGNIQDQVCRAVQDRNSHPPPPQRTVYMGDRSQHPPGPFMGGEFERRNNYGGGNQYGFENRNQHQNRGFESGNHYGAGDRELERMNSYKSDARGFIRSRSPRYGGHCDRLEGSGGGGGDLRGRLPPKDTDNGMRSAGRNKTVGRKDLDKEMDEWRREKEKKDKSHEKDKSRERGGYKGKNLQQKSLDDELDELAAKRERVKKKNVTNKSDTDDIIEVTLDGDNPVKKKPSEDENIDCITLD